MLGWAETDGAARRQPVEMLSTGRDREPYSQKAAVAGENVFRAEVLVWCGQLTLMVD
jgi:hypothetical protein